MDLVYVIFDVIDLHIDRITNIFIKNQETEITQLGINLFPLDEKIILSYNLQLNQKKLYNILSNFYKLLLVKDNNIKSAVKNVNLAAKLMILMLFSGQKTLKLLSQIVKIFLSFYDNNDIEFLKKKIIEDYEKYFIFSSFLNDKDQYSFLIEYLFSISLKKDFYPKFMKYDENTPHLSNEIICDILKFLYKTEVWKEKINNYIINSINEKKNFHNCLSIVGIRVGYFSFGKSVICNYKLKLNTKKLNHKFDNNDLNFLVKNGYYVDFIEASKFQKIKKKEKNPEDSDSELV